MLSKIMEGFSSSTPIDLNSMKTTVLEYDKGFEIEAPESQI